MLSGDIGLRQRFDAEHVARLACLRVGANIGCCTLVGSSRAETALWTAQEPWRRMPPWVNELASLVDHLGQATYGSNLGTKRRVACFHFGQTLAIPIFRDGVVVGAVGAATEERQLWTTRHRDRLEDVARYAAVQRQAA